MQVKENDELTEAVIGAALEVHSVLGPGFLESVYEEALVKELEMLKIPFEAQKTISLNYKGYQIGHGRLDLLVDQRLIVELKAVECIMPIHTAQVLSYLKTTELTLGLIINFNVPSLRTGIKRVILSRNKNSISLNKPSTVIKQP